MTNLVKEIAAHITDTAIFPQPELSLAASIAAVGTIMGHCFRTETDLRSNMYVFSVSESGTGKDHPRQYIQKLFKEAGIGKRVRNRAASGAGLVGALHRANGVMLLQTDEVGKELENLHNKRAGVHMREIPALMTELFSTANGYYYDKDLSNRDGKAQPRDIDQPCLSINGSTVPGPLYESMSSASILDGFLSRFLIFEGDPMVDPIDGKGLYGIDEELVKIIHDTVKMGNGVAIDMHGDMDFTERVIDPQIVYMDENAKKLFHDFRQDMHERKKQEIKNHTGLGGIWARATEHTAKLALVGHDMESGKISLDCVEWAIEIVKPRIRRMLDVAEDHISDNQTESDKKKLLRVVKEAEDWISKRDLTRKTSWLNVRDRKDILSDLLESDIIEENEITGLGRKKVTAYRCNKSKMNYY